MSLFRRLRPCLSIFALFLMILWLGGCGGGGSSTAQVRFLHTSSDGLNLTLTWHGNWLLSDLAFQEDTEYFETMDPHMDIRVVETFSGQEITKFDAFFTENTDYTIIFVNPSSELEALILTDDLEPPPMGEFKLRFLNMAPSAGDVDIYIIPPGFTLDNTIALAQDISYKGGTMYFTPDPGAYRLVVTVTGTTTVLKETAELSFADGSIRSAVLMDNEGGGEPFALKILSDAN